MKQPRRNAMSCEENRKIPPITGGRDEKGRFTHGNPGRPRGARNRVNPIAEGILDDGVGEIAQKCLELAREGNVQCLLAILKLRIPAVRDASIQQQLELPKLETAKDGLSALHLIAEAAARGDIDADHAKALVGIVEAFLKTLEMVNMEERIRALEARQDKENRREAA
jgi:hypothetical protein